MSPTHHTIRIIILTLLATPLLPMKKDVHTSLQHLRLQLFTAIQDNDPQEVALLLAHGAKVKIKAKKN